MKNVAPQIIQEVGFDFKVFDEIPEKLVEQVDRLLEADESNNRIKDTSTLSEYSKEHYCSAKDRFKYIVVLNSDQVVGIILFFKREIDFKGRKILVGGIGGVGTKTEYRGQGIATKMLSMVNRTLKEAGCVVGFLDTDFDNSMLIKIYSRIGFTALGRAFTYLGKSGKRHFSNEGMIAPINSQQIYDEVLKDKGPFDIGRGAW